MRVMICGGGVIGACTAYFLSQRGIDVTVVERTEVAAAASGKAGGFLALDWCAGSPLDALARRSFGLHAVLSGDIGGGFEISGPADSGSIRRHCRIRRRPSRAAEADLHRGFDNLVLGPRGPRPDCPDRRIDYDPCRDPDLRRGRRAACLDRPPGRPGGPHHPGASSNPDPSRGYRLWIDPDRFADPAVAGH
jgi:hypothetical protein